MARSKKYSTSNKSEGTAEFRATASTGSNESLYVTVAVPIQPNCPSCGLELTHVGRTATTKEKIHLCHNELKAFKGDPPTEFIGDRTRRSIYHAIKNNEESTINIEDIVLN